MNVSTNRMYLILCDSARAFTKCAQEALREHPDLGNEGATTMFNCLDGAVQAIGHIRNLMHGCDCEDHETLEQDKMLTRVIRAQNHLMTALDLFRSDLHYAAETDMQAAIDRLEDVSEVLNLRIELPELADS